jgi:hypothetical protein
MFVLRIHKFLWLSDIGRCFSNFYAMGVARAAAKSMQAFGRDSFVFYKGHSKSSMKLILFI